MGNSFSTIWTGWKDVRPLKPYAIDNGRMIKQTSWQYLEKDFTVSMDEAGTVTVNTLYFPGWTIYVDGSREVIEWQNPTYRGLMTFRMVPGANQAVRVIFGDTKVRKVSDWLSIVSLVFVTMTGVGVMIWRKK